MDCSSTPKEVTTEVCRGYDIIGDVHGCYDLLVKLLTSLGYKNQRGVYQQPNRRAIFLGDIIDRGSQIKPALELVRAMVEAGKAHMVLGNHEYNLIAYLTKRVDGSSEYLHRHNERHSRNLRHTLEQFRGHKQQLNQHVAWLQQLPLCLQLNLRGNTFRCVHACWQARAIELIHQHKVNAARPDEFWQATIVRGSWQKHVLDCCTRGLHLRLPDDMRLLGNDGSYHKELRIKYWLADCRNYGQVAISQRDLAPQIASMPLSAEQREYFYCYTPEQPPLFFGHYWFEGQPALLSANLACLDYSAVRSGQLVAYSYNGESHLNATNLVVATATH